MSRRALLVCLGLLLITRLALVLGLADVFFYGEELAKGAAAKTILDGLAIPHWQRIYVHHEGGGFVVSHLKALFFLLVGENVLANKLVALTTTTLLFLVGARLCALHFGARAATVFGLLFALAPSSFLRFSLLSLGTHFEALILIALVLDLALRIAREPAGKDVEHLALGLAAGFGLYVSLQTVPATACAALYLVHAQRGRIFHGGTLAALGGFVVGATPLLWMASHVGRAALRAQSEEPPTSVVDAANGLVAWLGPGADLFDWGYLVLFALGGLYALARGATGDAWTLSGARAGAWRIAGYLALYLLLYLTSGLAIGNANWFFYLRLAPVWFAALVLFAAGTERWLARARPARGARAAWAAQAAVAFLALGGVCDLVALFRDARAAPLENLRLLVATKGYDYNEYLDKLLPRLALETSAKIALVRGYDEDPELLYPAVNRSLFQLRAQPLVEAISIGRRAWGESWMLGLPGLGLACDPSYGHRLDEAWPEVLALPAELQPGLAEALGRVALGLKYDETKLRAVTELEVPPELRASFLHGVGWRLYRLHRLRPDRARAFVATLAPELGAEVEAGWSAAWRANSLR